MHTNITFTSDQSDALTISLITIFSFFCFTGNPLVIYIMTRPELRNVSLFRFLAVASFLNMVKLFEFVVLIWPDTFGVSNSRLACKFIFYFGYLPHHICNWALLWSGLDRYISVKYPNKYKFRNTIKFEVLIWLVLLFLGLLIQIPYYFNADVISHRCQTIDLVLSSILSIVISLISVIIPGILMILITILVFKRLVTQKKKLRQSSKKEISFLKALVSIDGLFLVCYMPYCISVIVTYISGTPFLGTLLYRVTNYFCIFYNSFDFFVYFFSNKLFRNYCISIFCGSRFVNSKKTTKSRNDMKTLHLAH
jgi:hypothetical protein